VKLASRPQPAQNLTGQGYRDGVGHGRGEWNGQAVFVKSLVTCYEGQQQRFLHEGAIASRLSHRLVTPLLLASPSQLIFPLIEGCSLRELISAAPLEPRQAVAVAEGVLQALVYLHAQGVVHHDLKPENIMLVGGEPRAQAVRIIDFGMAHDRRAAHDTHAGTRMGTPHFMAPEQFQGVRGDPRSDLYALSVLLWDALCGQPPYADPLGWLLGFSDTRAALPGPAALHPLLERSLSRDPQERPQSAREMLALLREAARGL